MRNLLLLLVLSVILFSCEEDFDIVTEYKDQTVVYAFLEHKDPWISSRDTHFVVVNKAFLGEANVYDMAAAADSVNYPDYDVIDVTLQRIKTIDPSSDTLEPKIHLEYTTHYKDSGAFSREHNVVFYTTANLMNYQDMSIFPSPNTDESYFYKLSVKKPNQEEVYATTKMIRGLYEDYPLSARSDNRWIEMGSPNPGFTFPVTFGSNIDARMYAFRIRIYYYEKKTDGNIYLDYVDYEHPVIISSSGHPTESEEIKINVSPAAFFSTIERKLSNTSDVVWRAPKILSKTGLIESHTLMFTLADQNTYIYNQVTQPSNGIVQEKPTYSNITNGLGLFASKWNYSRDQFQLTSRTIDSLAIGLITQELKFKDYDFTANENGMIEASDVIKRY